MTIYSIPEQFELMLKDGEQALFGLDVSPLYHVERQTRLGESRFLFFRSGKEYRVLAGMHDQGSNGVQFIRDCVGKKFDYRDFRDRIAKTDEFIEAYKQKYYQLFCIRDDATINMIEEVVSLNFDAPMTRRSGQDGFDLFCYRCIDKKEIMTWCYYYDLYFAPLLNLANIFLDFIDVPPQFRFQFRQ